MVDLADHADGRIHARPHTNDGPVPAPPGPRPLRIAPDRDGLSFVPQSYSPARASPLLVMLHGAGATAENIVALVTPHAEASRLVVLAPDSRGSSWDLIASEYGPDVAFVDAMLDQAFRRYAVDRRHIAIGGFSDGASYAASLGLINGELFTHVLAFSPGFAAPTETRDSPRFFVSHGRQDQVLPIDSCSRRLVPRLRQAGYDVTYREFDGGHVVPEAIAREAVGWFTG